MLHFPQPPGVTCIHIDDDVGLNYVTLKEGLRAFNTGSDSS